METQLKELYGRRFTPASKILVLIAIILLGISLAYKGNRSERTTIRTAPIEHHQDQLSQVHFETTKQSIALRDNDTENTVLPQRDV